MQQDLGYYYYNVCDQRRYRESKGRAQSIIHRLVRSHTISCLFFFYLEFHHFQYFGPFFFFFLTLPAASFHMTRNEIKQRKSGHTHTGRESFDSETLSNRETTEK